MAKVLLGVTGSVAAIKVPQLATALREQRHEVRFVATTAALYFLDPTTIAPAADDPTRRDPNVFSLDEDEWPGRDEGRRWRSSDPVRHIELRRWAELFLIAPLDANTFAKLATGIADNCLTCVWRAWDLTRPIVLAPAMNTLMWQHPYTKAHIRQLGVLGGAAHVPGHLDELATIAQINARSPSLRIVPPQVKALACGDVGIGALAEIDDIVTAVQELLGSLPPQPVPN